jgi:hypothetical protein
LMQNMKHHIFEAACFWYRFHPRTKKGAQFNISRQMLDVNIKLDGD